MSKIIQEVILADALEVLKKLKDDSVDLLLTDPDYGIYNKAVTGFMKDRADYGAIDQRISEEYFQEMKRISKNQVIFGGNYYLDILGNCPAPIIWDKQTGKNYFADGEFAWTSFQGTLRIYRHQWCGCYRGTERGTSFHPYQKPVVMFKWIIEKFTKEGDLICDPFCGGGTTAIASLRSNRNYICVDRDPQAIETTENRISQYWRINKK